MNFLTSLLAQIIEPILESKINELKDWFIENQTRIRKFEEYDKEALKHIENAKNASTTEEVKAHLRRLYDDRARFDL
jgi:hypothetical protein